MSQQTTHRRPHVRLYALPLGAAGHRGHGPPCCFHDLPPQRLKKRACRDEHLPRVLSPKQRGG